MPEDNIAELLNQEGKAKSKEEKPPEPSEREKEFMVIEELVAEIKTLFLADKKMELETVFEEIKSRLDDIGKSEEDREKEENDKKVDEIIEAKGKSLTTIDREAREK